MGKKCCVTGCEGNYNNGTKASVYRFPQNPAEKERWRKSIPRDNIPTHPDTVVCAAHWPRNFEYIVVRKKIRPKNPPSKFDEVKPSMIPTPPPKPRTTKKAHASNRNILPDELASFVESDKLDFPQLQALSINQDRFKGIVMSYIIEDVVHLQSELFSGGVPMFLIKIHENLRFETFHFGIKCYIPSLSKNYITVLDTWSKLEECIRYLRTKEMDHQQTVIQDQMHVMTPAKVGMTLYGPEVIVRAFEYFATSRTLYKRLRKDLKLPSETTLTRITSKVASVPENSFLNKIFKTLEGNQKLCILLHDEIYIKKMLLLHGGTIFGRAINDPSSLAKTILGIMIVCLYGGPKFLSKMIPLSKLDAKFLMTQVNPTVEAIDNAGGKVKAIISDSNRVNQSFFKNYETVPDKPWLTKDGKYLLFDNTHLLKCIRNLWLTEKTRQLQYDDNGIIRIAKWDHLTTLYNLEKEAGAIVKMSNLDEIAIKPKPIERQKVTTCLKVFCERTHIALLNHPGMGQVSGIEDTAIFIKKVLDWWKIVNVKGLGAGVRHNNELEDVIRDPSDTRLDYLKKFGDMSLKMMPKKQGQRVRQLSKDTAKNIHHTCYGLVDLCKHLLSTSHDYVCLGKFTTDYLEKEFGKLRQGSGGTYFISAQQVLEKLHIKQSSLLMSLNIDVDEFNVESGHQCSSCSYLLCEEGAEVFDNLAELELSIPDETKMSLVYIAGYVTRNDPELSEKPATGTYNFLFSKIW